MTIEIFFSYAPEDEDYLKRIKLHLSVLQKRKLMDVIWHDHRISAGTEWAKEIDSQLNAAHIILLLVSPDFMASDYCTAVIMDQALKRHKQEEARVVPVILRPCLWEETAIRDLQVLPALDRPVSTWQNSDEALLHIALGVREIIQKISIQLLTRQITLFGYEIDGGTNSILWKNPQKFTESDGYFSWLEMKRPFVREEIVYHTWIKVSHFGDYWGIHFADDGTLTEYSLFDPNNSWGGSWKLIDGMLRISIAAYETDAFALSENTNYSAIEFKGNSREPWAYHVFFPVKEKDIRHWNLAEASALVTTICKRVLQRPAKAEDFIFFGALLCRGEASVRDIVKLIALSPEYKGRFIYGKTIDEALELCYGHLLGRRADNNGKRHYSEKVKKTGFDAIILELIDSSEYTTKFGEDSMS